MNWYKIFYWLSVADNFKMITGWLSLVLGIYFIIAAAIAIGVFEEGTSFSDWEKGSKRVFHIFSTFFFINVMLWSFLPSKKDALLIVAGGGAMNFLTTDSSAKKLPSELTNFVVTEIKSMAKDAEVQLELNNQKDRILEEAKNMTSSELMNRMKVDSNFAKIILNN